MSRADRSLHTLRWFSQTSLVALAVALPFELVKPVAPLGPLQLSSVEVFLYATVLSWLASRCLQWTEHGITRPLARTLGLRHPVRRPLIWWRSLPEAQRAAALWSLILLIAGVLAPLARGPAVKFALRSLGGVVLFVAAADLLDSRRAVWRAMAAIGAGAVLASLLMGFELAIGTSAALLLRPFHVQTFGVLGLARASGPFQYPNIASMYLEAALPVMVATGAVAAGNVEARRAPRVLAATIILALVILYALVLAASRAGLVTGFVVLLGVAALARGLPTLRRLSIGLAAGLIAITLVAQAVSPLLALRLRFWEERSWYGSAIEATPDGATLPSPLPLGNELKVSLSVLNLGAMTWPAAGPKAVRLSYHWMSEDGETLVVLDGARTDLPHDVAPDEKIDLTATVTPPAQAGRYILWWDMVHENVTWFSDAGNPGYRQWVLSGPLTPGRKGKGSGGKNLLNPNAIDEFSRTALWRAGLLALRDHPLLGLGPDNFRRAYGDYLGRTGADTRLHANNFYIEVLATLGICGLLALALLIVTLGRTARRAARARENQPLVLGAGAALVAYLVHGVLDYFLEFTPTYGLFWLLAGVLVALEKLAGGARTTRGERGARGAILDGGEVYR